METKNKVKPADPMTAEEVKKLKSIDAEITQKGSAETKFDQQIETEVIDGLIYPKGGEAIGVKAESGPLRSSQEQLSTEGFIPKQAGFSAVPKPEAKKDHKPAFIDRNTFMGNLAGVPLKTIFGPDNRRVFYDTTYPWRCSGKVESALGSGSGVMIGPRHLLTCSHIVDWRPNNQTGWIKFTPLYYNGSVPPFGFGYAVKVYYNYKVSGPTIDGTEAKFDYTVIVLDKRLGNATGWLGSKTYSDSWDGQAVFTHTGYPGDLTGSQRPVYQNGIALDGNSSSAQNITHKGDIWPGQSGGPFFAYWDGKPYTVAVQSYQNASVNGASGGADMVRLIQRALAEYP